jgi:hypothetical protein
MYSGMAFPGVPCYRKVFEEDAEYTQELEKLLFSCSSWSKSRSSASDLWQSEEHLQYLLSEHGLDEVSTFNTATPSFKLIFGRMD